MGFDRHIRTIYVYLLYIIYLMYKSWTVTELEARTQH